MFRDDEFKKSSACGTQGTGCVEVAITATKVAVRDSKRPELQPFIFDQDEWRSFILGVKNNEFDL